MKMRVSIEVFLKASACSSVDSLQRREFSGTLGLPYTLMLLVCHAVFGWPPSLSAYQHGRATEREGERERETMGVGGVFGALSLHSQRPLGDAASQQTLLPPWNT